MGGSLAMALRGRCAALLGVDRDPRTLALALEWGVVERAGSDPEKILPEADLVILSVPVQKIIAYLTELPRLHPGNPIVIDLGSTKKGILQAMADLPERFDPLGGHPMCGKESSSLENADPLIYQEATFAFVSLPRTSALARRLAEELAVAVGAHALWLEAETHDRWVANTSQVPYLVANALAGSVPLEAAPLVGPGFRSTARLAGSSLEMMGDILATNQMPILEALQKVRQRLEKFESLLEYSQFEDLQRLLSEGRNQYHTLVAKEGKK